jgi:Anti-sigma-K factor rskA
MTAADHSPRFDELLPAYALGALDGDDLRDLAAHLAAECSACESELRRLAAEVEDLATAAAEIPESLASEAAEILGGVKERLLAELPLQRRPTRLQEIPEPSRSAAAPPAPAAAFPAPPAAFPAPPASFQAPAAPYPAPPAYGARTDRSARAPHSFRRWAPLAAAAVLALVAVWGLLRQASMGAEIERLRGESRRLAARSEALERLAAQAQAESRRLARTLSIIAAPGVESVRLAGMGTSHSAAGRTYVNVADRKAVFYAFGLPALGPDKTYQLWYLDEQDHPTSAGVFAVDARGKAALVVDQSLPVERIQAWAVTIEPRGGRPQPTGPMALAG